MAALRPDWPARYVGLPFVDGGRGRDGLDCWGCVRLVYADLLGIDLPDYGEIAASDLRGLSEAITAGAEAAETWRPVEQPRAFDVCVMRFHGKRIIGHVGVMIDACTVLHVERRCHAVAVPLTHWTIRDRIACFRRHISQS